MIELKTVTVYYFRELFLHSSLIGQIKNLNFKEDDFEKLLSKHLNAIELDIHVRLSTIFITDHDRPKIQKDLQ